ncbi:MAG TPA: copper chaperone PCu(A)C [Novosphingobium sp.]|nr:copper chaperone PCu(A)C [Novosphingobium sp.]
MPAIRLVPLIALALVACKPAAEQTADEAASSEVEAKPGLSASKGRLVLPTVTGNPGAAYFTLANSGATSVVLGAVYVDGADKAEMHQTSGGSMAPLATLELPAGKTDEFAPGGKHVMVFGLDPKLASGASVTMTLTFADGDKLSAPLTVEKAGATMDHGDMP